MIGQSVQTWSLQLVLINSSVMSVLCVAPCWLLRNQRGGKVSWNHCGSAGAGEGGGCGDPWAGGASTS